MFGNFCGGGGGKNILLIKEELIFLYRGLYMEMDFLEVIFWNFFGRGGFFGVKLFSSLSFM